jgi:hypothetical protein
MCKTINIRPENFIDAFEKIFNNNWLILNNVGCERLEITLSFHDGQVMNRCVKSSFLLHSHSNM